jgi:uncharacterized protein (TIGR00369 family)
MTLQMTKDELQIFLASEFPQLGADFQLIEVGDDLRVKLITSDKHVRPGGTISGPSMFALADVAMYMAILARLGPVALAVTTNCSIDFMRKPASGVDLIATAQVLKLGRVLAVGDVLIQSDGDDRPVARAGLTYSIPPKP